MLPKCTLTVPFRVQEGGLSHKGKGGGSRPPRGASAIQIGRRDSVVQVRCPGEGVFRQPAMRDREGTVQPGDAGESVPAMPPVDINTRAANRQTVELVLDGAVQFGIVHVLAHGATSVLDFGGERMSEAELVSLMSFQKTLQFVFLACCNTSTLQHWPEWIALSDRWSRAAFSPGIWPLVSIGLC